MRTIHLIFIIAGLLISTLFVTALSEPLWDNLPLLSFVQFPWRFLSVQAFFGALAISGIALIPYRQIAVPVIVILLLGSALGKMKLDFLEMDDRFVTAQHLAEYEWFTGNIGSTVSAEYLPDSVVPRPFTSPWLNDAQRDHVQVLEGDVETASLRERRTSYQRWQFDVGSSSASVALPTISWPGWSLYLDEKEIDGAATAGSGLILVELPSGEHKLELSLGRTPVRLAAEAASLIGIALLLWLVLSSAGSAVLRWLLIGLAGGIFLVFLAFIVPKFESPVDALNWDFDQRAYLHQGGDGIEYDNGLVLEEYSYASHEIYPGETLEIRFMWKKARDEQLAVELFSPAGTRSELAPAIASQQQPLNAGEVAVELEIPEDAPAGPLLPRLSIPNAAALTPSGERRGDLYLQPVMVQAIEREAQDVERDLEVRPVDVFLRSPDILDVHLQWYTSESLSHNYNFSLRLVDAEGNLVSQFDGQPGFGYQPSSGWNPGHWINDWLALPVPLDLDANQNSSPYSLVVNLYDVAGAGDDNDGIDNDGVVLIRHLGTIEWQDDKLAFNPGLPADTVPPEMIPQPVLFDEAIEFLGYRLVDNRDRLALELYWRSHQATAVDFLRFVHVVDPNSGEIVYQDDAIPRHNTLPTSQWRPGSVVKDVIYIDPDAMAPGEYRLYLGLYEIVEQNLVRPVAIDEDGRPIPDGRVELTQTLVIEQ